MRMVLRNPICDRLSERCEVEMVGLAHRIARNQIDVATARRDYENWKKSPDALLEKQEGHAFYCLRECEEIAAFIPMPEEELAEAPQALSEKFHRKSVKKRQWKGVEFHKPKVIAEMKAVPQRKLDHLEPRPWFSGNDCFIRDVDAPAIELRRFEECPFSEIGTISALDELYGIIR